MTIVFVFFFTDVLQTGRENTARKTCTTWLHPQVYLIFIFFIVRNITLQHSQSLVTSKLYLFINKLPPLSMSLYLSWNSDWGDSRDCGPSSCFGLCCQEEAQPAGEATEQLAQYAIHAQTAKL